MAKQNYPWSPKELTEKLVVLTNEGNIRWIGAGWGFRAFISTESVLSDVAIDLEHKEGDSGSEMPYIPPTADTYTLYIKGSVSNDLLFWNNQAVLLKPLWLAADKQIQPKLASYGLRGKTYSEVNRNWPKSKECAALQKALKNL